MPNYLTILEARDALAARATDPIDTTTRTVRRWCAEGLLAATRFGEHSWMVEESQLETFERPKLGRRKEEAE